jgi:lipopolysaccharide heptosyltransferase I
VADKIRFPELEVSLEPGRMPSRPIPDLRRIEPRRVCLIKPSSLGDVVHATPALAALRLRWPDAHLAWVVNSGLAPLVDGVESLDEVIPFDRARAGRGPLGWLEAGSFMAGLARRRFDLAIDLQGLLRSAVMTVATRAPLRVGLADAREGAAHAYTHAVQPEPAHRHAVDRMLDVARAFGCEISEPRFEIATNEADLRWAERALRDVPHPRLALNVGARWLTKRWPPENFAAIARRAVLEFGAGLVAVGAAADKRLVERLIHHLGGVPIVNLCGRTSLTQLASSARHCAVFVSNDSGPLHLAAAAGCRVVGVYTCTSPLKTGPYGSKARAVESRIWCAASCLKTCDRMECMAELTPEHVWPAVREQLEAAALKPSAA